MAVDIRDIRWLAGWLEGEGSFHHGSPEVKNRSSAVISAVSTDQDIIQRVAKLLGGKCRGPYKHKNPKGKDYFQTSITSGKAIQWMMTLYSLMGIRRRKQISEVIKYWKSCTGPYKLRRAQRVTG